jgi:RsmE family RNA methyltransferase
MNLILFEKDEIGRTIPGYDPRAKHIRRTLRCKAGDTFEAGIINGKIGTAKILAIDKKQLVIDFVPELNKTEPNPVILIVGLTRPQIAKHIFRESASMGIDKLWFYPTELGEKSYLESDLWQEENYRSQQVKGAGQGVTSNLPAVRIFYSLKEVLDNFPPDYERICLDNVRPEKSLTGYQLHNSKAAILLGSERGLTDKERDFLEAREFVLLKMGDRVLRTDTACIAGLTLVLSKLGLM